MTKGDRGKQGTRGREISPAKGVRSRRKGEGPHFKYCVPERMSLDELGKVRLPGPDLTMNELFRQFFDFESNFAGCVRALEEAGRLPRRSDGSYRLSDGYRIMSRTLWDTAVAVGNFKCRPAFAPVLFLDPLDETWWNALDAVAGASKKVQNAQNRQVIRNRRAGTLRVASGRELHLKAQRVLTAAQREQRDLVKSLPAEQAWWKVRLRTHAQLVVELRDAGLLKLARLCSGHLAIATDLAQIRLQLTRPKLRALVGVVDGDMTTTALTAASFSLATRAHDEAFDALVQLLPGYNAAAVPALQLDPDGIQELLEHLTQAGLDDWVVQLSAETWTSELLSQMNEDQRIAMVFGRVRTMCILLEESMLTFAAVTRNEKFINDVEQARMMGGRLEVFVRGPADKSTPVPWNAVSRLIGSWTTRRSISPEYLKRALNNLMMPAGNPAPPPGPSSPRVLAGLFFIRNLTSHRFPVLISRVREPWFDTWGAHLPAINRTVAWSGLALWALVKCFR